MGEVRPRYYLPVRGQLKRALIQYVSKQHLYEHLVGDTNSSNTVYGIWEYEVVDPASQRIVGYAPLDNHPKLGRDSSIECLRVLRY